MNGNGFGNGFSMYGLRSPFGPQPMSQQQPRPQQATGQRGQPVGGMMGPSTYPPGHLQFINSTPQGKDGVWNLLQFMRTGEDGKQTPYFTRTTDLSRMGK